MMPRSLVMCFATFVFAVVGCGQANPQVQDSTNSGIAATPEAAYRNLMLANDEKTIRSLILERDDADVLWEGGQYPKDVAELLAEQYRTMEISREGGDETKGVVMHSSAFPLPLTAVKVDGFWKIDAGPLIELRNAFKKPLPATH